MAVRKLSQGNKIGYSYVKWLCDDIEEMAKIPPCPMGSTVYVVHTRDTYMMDSNNVWYCMTSPAEPIKCDCVEELTIWGDIPTNE